MGLKISSKRFVLSDETKNLYGFVTKTDGIDLSAFDENPVMLYNHDYTKVIGVWTDYRIEGIKLTGVPGFDDEDDYAMQQYKKVEAEILKGVSVGISPIQFDEQTNTMVKSLLLEASLTPVPNNKKALAIYNATGVKLSTDEIKTYLLSVERTDNHIINDQKMNEKLILALVALCVQSGQTINLTAASTPEDFEGAIKKVGEVLTGLQAEKITLTANVTRLQKEQTDAVEKEITDAVSLAVNLKQLTAEEAPALIAFGKVNLSAFKTLLGSLKPVTLTAIPGAAAAAVTVGREAWTFDDYAAKDSIALSAMQASDPEKFNKLLSAKQSAVRNTGQVGAIAL